MTGWRRVIISRRAILRREIFSQVLTPSRLRRCLSRALRNLLSATTGFAVLTGETLRGVINSRLACHGPFMIWAATYCADSLSSALA